ncbi:NAD(P)/FAD-dependent oxidoreductase [Nocardia aurea]|uniref:NAD(P)/FAD-dependent oxidoreductase n=1 Tax=Nocardia aurea TaxID=2144174 RepID=UPI0013001F9E|nr:FAD-dependent oxidoreductase [Nocardia aurea]
MTDPSANGRVVVVGAGQAGAEVVAALRQGKYSGPITMIGEEPLYPYSRPPLSKAYLKGTSSAADLLLRRREVYEQHNIDVQISTSVKSIDPQGRSVALGDGQRLPYDHLVMATGGQARTLPGTVLAPNVHYMRTKVDADALRDRMTLGSRVVVVGGGYIGLEFAAVARALGVEVVVVEVAPRLLARVSSPVIADFYRCQHIDRGVDVSTGSSIEGFDHDQSGAVTAVRLASGRSVPADFVVVGIGLVPRTELAEAAGIAVEDGILVDAHMSTSAPGVYAVGDVARFPEVTSGTLRRLESVPNATEQAKVAAASILGRPRPYEALPWFWSDQYDLKLQVAGVLEHGHELVVRGDPRIDTSFMVLHLNRGRVRCAEVVNDPAGFAAAKRLIVSGQQVPVEALRAGTKPLKEALALT